MRFILSSLLFSILFLPLNSFGSSGTEKDAEKIELPNPLHLQSNWPQYFNVTEEKLEVHIANLNTLLKSFYDQFEASEEKESVAKKTSEILSHLESLKELKKQVIETPTEAWIPRSSYQLDEYLEVSDKIQEISDSIDYLKSDLKQSVYSISNLSQTLSNTYARYLNIKERSQEKFLLGLEVLSLGTRRLYLQAEADLSREVIRGHEERLSMYVDKRKVIAGNLKPVVDFDKLKNEREKLTGEKGHVQQEIAELETKSIQRHAKFNGNEESRLMNQKLLNAQIKEALITSQLFFLDTEITYYKTFNSPEKIHYQDNIKPIQAFRRETQDQMNSWEEIASAGMNQISQALITINENNQEERNVTYRETLNLSVSNQALLDALSKKLHHIQLVNNLINERIIETQSTSDQFAFHLNNSWYSLKNSMGNWFYYSLFDIGGVPITIMGIIKAILIILFSFWFSSFISKGTHKFAKGNGKVGEPTLYTFRRIFHYVIILLGILFAFGSLGLTIGNLAIVLGALSIGLGFGLQNIVNNFLCGLAILFERNVKVGDIIELEEGLIGKVMEVNVQNTTLHTFDSLDVLVPNSSVVGKNVINWTKNSSFLRYHVPFQVAYGTDQRLVSEVVSKAALKVDYTITDFPGIPEPDVWLVKFGDSSLHYELIVWIDLYQSKGQKGILAAYLSEIEFALAENNIHIPFPQRDLHIKSVPENMIYSGYQK